MKMKLFRSGMLRIMCVLLLVCMSAGTAYAAEPRSFTQNLWYSIGHLITGLAPAAVSAPTASLAITSNPSAATIYIDNKKAGATPFSVSLSLGSHAVKLTKAGYKDYSTTVKISAGANKLNAKLEKVLATPAAALLTVTSTPSGANVYINVTYPQKYMGQTPLKNVKLDAVLYIINITKKDYKDYVVQKKLIAGSNTVDAKLVKIPQPPVQTCKPAKVCSGNSLVNIAGNCKNTTSSCPYGCANGKCNSAPTCKVSKTCVGNNIVSTAANCKNTTSSCPYGCANGACKPKPAAPSTANISTGQQAPATVSGGAAGAVVNVCGDKKCVAPENCNSCPKDCACASGQICKSKVCVKKCGDGTCSSDENCNSCLGDCKCPTGQQCKDNKKCEIIPVSKPTAVACDKAHGWCDGPNICVNGVCKDIDLENSRILSETNAMLNSPGQKACTHYTIKKSDIAKTHVVREITGLDPREQHSCWAMLYMYIDCGFNCKRTHKWTLSTGNPDSCPNSWVDYTPTTTAPWIHPEEEGGESIGWCAYVMSNDMKYTSTVHEANNLYPLGYAGKR